MSYLLHQLKKSTPLHSSNLIYTDKYCKKYLHYVTLFTFSVLSTYISHRQVHYIYIFVTASVSLRAVFLFLFFFYQLQSNSSRLFAKCYTDYLVLTSWTVNRVSGLDTKNSRTPEFHVTQNLSIKSMKSGRIPWPEIKDKTRKNIYIIGNYRQINVFFKRG